MLSGRPCRPKTLVALRQSHLNLKKQYSFIQLEQTAKKILLTVVFEELLKVTIAQVYSNPS